MRVRITTCARLVKLRHENAYRDIYFYVIAPTWLCCTFMIIQEYQGNIDRNGHRAVSISLSRHVTRPGERPRTILARPGLRYCPTMREILWQTMTAARPAWYRRPPAIYDILLRDLMTLNVSPLCLHRPSLKEILPMSMVLTSRNLCKEYRTDPWTEYT